jgi:polygalacturonase
MANICDFGAKGDGKTNNTEAFSKAIQKCEKGGKVVVPAGKFLTGPIHLKSDMTLHLEKDAAILFSNNPDDYPAVKSRWEGVECFGYSPCLYGEKLENVSVTGSGTIDGQGDMWWKQFENHKKGDKKPVSARDKEFDKLNEGIDLSNCGGGGIGSFFFRPPLVQFNNCTNVLLDGITTCNSPFWNVHLLYCKKVIVKNMTIKNPDYGYNGDGLDVDSCNGVEISDCDFDVNDDCLVIKSGIGEDGLRVNKVCENVVAKNCKMLRGHGSVVFGSKRRQAFEMWKYRIASSTAQTAASDSNPAEEEPVLWKIFHLTISLCTA